MPSVNPELWKEASPYLDRALELSTERRAEWLESLRASRPDLAGFIDNLLKEHGQAVQEHFLEHSPISPEEAAPRGRKGQSVGPYTLLSLIGQGGMGSVWLAERSDGRFERRVAMKFLRFALGGRGAGERFAREGKILGQLAHPGIAELIDAGVTPAGEPYLVLEYVAGEPIDEYCDGRGLDLEARIRLFLEMLSALAHAHTNLIVHRDIKPSNVLVRKDGQVKLLDFGIAKLLAHDGDSAAATLLTREGEGALTPYFAAPEQVLGGAITTATDIYAAGLLLYLLLTGQHPAGPGQQSPASLMKAIVDTEPLRPSDAISPVNAVGEAARSAAEKRATTPSHLRRQLRGDLDTIVAKALKKAPEERYGSITALADDLRRYLHREAISARADTFAYRATKFVRRNRVAVALAALAVIATFIGLIGTLLQARTARIERDAAFRERDRSNRITQFMIDMFGVSDPNRARASSITAREILDRASAQIETSLVNDPKLQAPMISVMGRTYNRLGLYSTAQPLLERAIDIGRRVNGPGDPDVLSSEDDLADLLIQEGRLADAEKLLQEALPTAQRALGRSNPITLALTTEVAYTLSLDGRNAEALDLARYAFAESRRVLGEEDTGTLWSMYTLAMILTRAGRPAESEPLYRQQLDIQRRIHGLESAQAAYAMNNLGATLIPMERLPEAQNILRQALAVDRRVFGPDAPETGRTLYNLACAAAHQEHRNEAFSFLHEAVGIVPVRTLLALEQDSDLNSLHGDPRWNAILVIAKQRIASAQKQN